MMEALKRLFLHPFQLRFINTDQNNSADLLFGGRVFSAPPTSGTAYISSDSVKSATVGNTNYVNPVLALREMISNKAVRIGKLHIAGVGNLAGDIEIIARGIRRNLDESEIILLSEGQYQGDVKELRTNFLMAFFTGIKVSVNPASSVQLTFYPVAFWDGELYAAEIQDSLPQINPQSLPTNLGGAIQPAPQINPSVYTQ